MRRTQSIGFRLAASFWLLFVVVIGIGMFGLNCLNDFNRELSDIRDRWLKNTRYLGDLNNYTSDFRAAEGAYLLAPSKSDLSNVRREIQSLDEAISLAQDGYEKVAHDGADIEQYKQFQQKWIEYRNGVRHILAVASAEEKAMAINIYMTSSRRLFASVSEILENLSNRNNQQAQQASDRANDAVRVARLFIGATIALGISIVLAILLYVNRQITAPLLDLAQCMRRLSHNEVNIDIHNTDRNDELGEMAQAVVVFRNNAIELRVSQRGLAYQASMLEEKLFHERQLNQNQRNFISMASHEFRTPMNVIDGHAQRLINAPAPVQHDVILDRARKIRTMVKRMSVMFDGLLHSSKLMEEDPGLYFHPLEFDMKDLLIDVCRLHKEITPTAVLTDDLGEKPVPCHGDRNLLFLALSNLVSNAIKYSLAGAAIVVKVRAEDAGLTVSVEDHGCGIPKRDMDRLFERYYRGSNVSSIVGTGIGLYLVKVVIELHGGSISVESEENRGSCFTATIPFVNVQKIADHRYDVSV